MSPVNWPNSCITAGNTKGAMLSKMPPTTVPVIMLPNSRTAKANALDTSPMMLNGSINGVGSMYVRSQCFTPLWRMEKKGTEKNTQRAKANVVSKLVVGAVNTGNAPGINPLKGGINDNTLDVAMNKNSVPTKGK